MSRCSKFYGTINGKEHPVSNGPKGSLEDAYECNLTEALKAELLADGLQGAPLDALKEDAHIFEAGSKLLLAIPRVLLQQGRPLAHLSVEDADGQVEGTRCDVRWRIDQHALLDQCQLDQVLSQVEELVSGLRDLAEALEESIA